MTDGPALSSLLAAAGVAVRRQGHRIRFDCPACCVPGHTKERWTGAGSDESGGWGCYRASCGARGGWRQMAALLGVGAVEERERPKPAPAHDAGGRVARSGWSAAQAWREVRAAQGGPEMDAVYRWALARGWSAGLAGDVALLDDVACIGAPGGRDSSALASLARRWRRRLCVPIRCAAGEVRSFALRWVPGDGDSPPSGPKTLTVPADMAGSPADWGGLMTYGSAADCGRAVADGRSVVVVEGAPDYLAAAAARDALDGAAVVALYSAGMAGALAQALAVEMVSAGRAGRVVILPHRDRPTEQAPRGAGMEAAMLMARVLRAHADVRIGGVA